VPDDRQHAVVTGGAGFLGSHLSEHLIGRGWRVTVVDDLSTGTRENLRHLDPGAVTLVEADICDGLDVAGPVDAVFNLASPASPPAYLRRPLATLAVGSRGTTNALDVALRHGARFLMASTSEVYGDPLEHPQAETYWGNVNPVGPRSCYDEAKRFSEALTMAHHGEHGTDVRIVRIFNTYGPRLAAGDGRVVSNFLAQALRGEPLTVYGDGRQTRSFCYVDDLIRGILALFDSDLVARPVNVGNPGEFTILDLAREVLEVTGSSSELVHLDLPTDDPTRRRPDISLARAALNWAPRVSLRDGLGPTAEWVAEQVGRPAGA
jgi:dTDP-glucose 4,6-dehydratase